MISYSEDQAQAFVADAGTLQRGKQLAQPTKWANLGRTQAATWGECAGSGSKPYLTGIDLREPAFKCSCPSRVFPCKHGAGLLLLLARQPALFAGTQPPPWLEEWLAKRVQTQEKKAVKVASTPPVAAENPRSAAPENFEGKVSEESGSGVSPARLARMEQGINELDTWLLDLVRHGLATLDQQPAKFWANQAARLVDNQLPGIAGIIRELGLLRHAHADWPRRLLARLGELYWLVRAFQNRDQVPAATRHELLQQVGVTIKKEELAAYSPPQTDRWQVLGQVTWEEDRLTARRSWLHGLASGRYALVLEFAFGSQPFATPLVPNGVYSGQVLYYPGPLPLRAAPVTLTFEASGPERDAPPAQRIPQLLDDYAGALARQPWLREWPAALSQVAPVRQPDGSWVLQHPNEAAALPLRFLREEAPWELLAQSGGHALTLFGEWDGQAFRPLGSWPWKASSDAAGQALAPPTALVSAAFSSAEQQGPTTEASPTSEALPEIRYPAFSQLLRIGLLGTRQSGESVPLLPGITSPADSPEQQLLLVAGTLALLHKAGFQPPQTAVSVPAPAPAESWEPLGPLGTELFRTLLETNRYGAFRTDYWTRMGQHQRLVPPSLLVAALNTESFRLHLPGPLLAILGERGRWLAQQNPEWQARLATEHPAEDPTTWETGTLPQRRFLLQNLRKSNPELARQLVAAALPTEPAATQAALLAELEHALTAADAPLLTSYLSSKSKEVRQTVVPLLVRLPESGLVERLWHRAIPLLTVKRPLVGRNKLVVALPEQWDKTWLTDGIELKTASFEGGERAGQLGQLLALIPPSRWVAHLQVSAEELLTLAEATDWRPLLLTAWARAAVVHQDQVFALPLLLRHFSRQQVLPPQTATHLLGLLTQAEMVAWVRRLLPPNRPKAPEFLPELLAYLPGPWPADIVRATLRHLADVLAPRVANHYAEPYQRLSALLTRLASSLPDDQVPACPPVLEPLAERYPAVAPLVEQFLDSVRFRQQLTASLTEPSTPLFY
ncbi:hypothetical protein GCM10027346_35880 [Hymenobacter seoulensis]